MKFLYLYLIGIMLIFGSNIAYSKPKVFTKDIRTKIGPTFSSPIFWKENYYSLSTSGVLYKINKEYSKATVLFEVESTTMSPLLLDGDTIFFGEGIHKDSKANYYSFNLSSEKLTSKQRFNGHIERIGAVDKDTVFIGAGEDGVYALNKKNLTTKWNVKKIKEGKLHVDSNFVFYKNEVCFASVYSLKGIVCLNKETGKERKYYSLKLSPKSTIGLSNNILYGLSTEANIIKMEWKKKSDLYAIDLDKKALRFEKELRGYNFFAPMPMKDKKVFIGISTGDMILISLETGQIQLINEFKEPFISSPFVNNGKVCTIGVMGMLFCFKNNKGGIKTDSQRFFESPIGEIVKMGPKLYIPSRIGHFSID